MRFFLIDNEVLLKSSRSEIGGKGWGLVRLKKQGLNVPSFGIISTEGVREKLWNTDTDFRDTIITWCREILTYSPSKKITVRSSACEEDNRYHSFAGKFLTEVITNTEELIPTLDKIAEQYISTMDKEEETISVGLHGLAIILQEFVAGEISGVCFSTKPMNANPQQGYCEMVIGENKLLVDGETQPTRVLFNPSTGEIVDYQEGHNGPQSLPEQLLAELSKGLLKMEWDYRTAVDMEWTWDGEKIWFLQVRPITKVTPSMDLYPKECMTCWFFDQRFIEPITPITRTTLIPLIFRKAIVESMNMRGKTATFEPYYFGGQVYIPHRAYFDLLEGCPKWWLSSDLKLLFPDNCGCPPKQMKLLGIHFWLDAFRSLLTHWQDSIFVLCRWEQWKKKLLKKLSLWNEAELSKLTKEDWLKQWEQWQELSEEFLGIHRWAILWSSYVYRLGGKYIVRGKEGQYPSITTWANYILTSYLSTRDLKLLTLLRTEYSHRTESLDFISPRWEEWLSGEAQNELFERQLLEEKRDISPPPLQKRSNAGLLYRIVAKFIHLREEQRFEWEKILNVQKKLLKEAGKRLVEKGILAEISQVWFINWQELIEAFIEGKAIHLKEVSERQHQWCVEHVFTKPSFINEGSFILSISEEDSNIWLGWGVSGGRVKGTAYVTDNPTSLPLNISHPRILVTPCLNPGQTWCLQYWDGVLLERGSELSHPAIIAREINIPMIANLPHITQKLTTGDFIHMDATYGKVSRISS
ncbi:MAG TPA: PEP/pyruvate-binding domain-containing protein [Candidatus Hydrogenedens sp.]|nr:PEP/pyruvate-binding domain-containing protein [Candidatus Hydrogenedens sp.]